MNTIILTFITTLSLLMGALNGTNAQKNIAINSAKKAIVDLQRYQNKNILGSAVSSTPTFSVDKKITTSTEPLINSVAVYSLEPGYFGFDSNPEIVNVSGKNSVTYTINSTEAKVEITLDGETKQTDTGTLTFQDKKSGSYQYVVKIKNKNFYGVIQGILTIP